MTENVDFNALLNNTTVTPGLDLQTPEGGHAAEGQTRHADLIRKAYECPRCLHLIPNDDMPGAYMGAGSRITEDRSIEICSACGTDEAMGNGPVPRSAWPVHVDPSLYEMNKPRR